MRILSVSHYAPPHVGGLEAVVGGLATQLAQRGNEVTAVTSTAGLRDGLGTPEGWSPEYRAIYVPALNKFLESRLGIPYPLFAPGLVPVLRREIARADVVHVHGFLFQSTLVALALARRAPHRPPTVLTEHVGHVPYQNPLVDATEATAIATLGRWAVRAADAVVVFNRGVQELVERLAPRSRLVWIDNGVDPGVFRPAVSDERSRIRRELGWDERPRVLFGGRAVAKKGLDVALEAARIADGAFILAVIGAMEPPQDAPHVERVGLLSREGMAAVFRAADALLVPSRGEGLPVTIQEALVSGVPVVATDDPGYRDALTGFGAGVRLMSPGAEAMASALVEMVRTPEARAAAAETVERARERFSITAFADQHERLYTELLAARSEPDRSAAAKTSEGELAPVSDDLAQGPGVRKGVGQLATPAARRNLLRQPRFFLRNLILAPRFYLDKQRTTGVEPFREYIKPEAEAVAAVLGVPVAEYERAARDIWMPKPDPGDPLADWNAREELLRMVAVIVKFLPARVMVETGVAVGFSTATALRAMEDAGEGHLYSIDLPAIQYDPDRAVGNAVPDELYGRWTLELGDSRHLLPALAAQVAPVDVFLHDALQTYSTQLLDFRIIWPHLRSGGVLMSDGVDNPAFVEFAADVGAEPHLVLGGGHPSAIALLRKP